LGLVSGYTIGKLMSCCFSQSLWKNS
jgi:hypothetical protein